MRPGPLLRERHRHLAASCRGQISAYPALFSRQPIERTRSERQVLDLDQASCQIAPGVPPQCQTERFGTSGQPDHARDHASDAVVDDGPRNMLVNAPCHNSPCVDDFSSFVLRDPANSRRPRSTSATLITQCACGKRTSRSNGCLGSHVAAARRSRPINRRPTDGSHQDHSPAASVLRFGVAPIRTGSSRGPSPNGLRFTEPNLNMPF